MDPLWSVIQDLEKGKESAHQMRSLLQLLQGSDGGDHDYQDYYKGFDDHSMVILSTFDNALSALQRSDLVDDLMTRARKVARTDIDDHHHHQSLVDCKSDQDLTPTSATPKDRRGSYKRRRVAQTTTVKVTSNLTDDGFTWRKYGQKIILNAKHPRNYYRCTHKVEQGCQATKQVQQISENPTQYKIIYQGEHTCNFLSCKSHLINTTPHPILSDHQDSSFLLSFGTHTTPPSKHALNPLISSSSSSPSPSPLSSPSSSSSSPFAKVKREYYVPIKDQMITSGPSDLLHGTHNVVHSSSSDLNTTSSTPVSDQSDHYQSDVISSSIDHQGFYSSLVGFHGMDEDYSYMMAEADPVNLDAVMQLQGPLCV